MIFTFKHAVVQTTTTTIRQFSSKLFFFCSFFFEFVLSVDKRTFERQKYVHQLQTKN